MEQDDLTRRFEFHPALNSQITPPGFNSNVEAGWAHEQVRRLCGEVAEKMNALLPEGREKSLAITKLEEAMMWGNAAIARNSFTPEIQREN